MKTAGADPGTGTGSIVSRLDDRIGPWVVWSSCVKGYRLTDRDMIPWTVPTMYDVGRNAATILGKTTLDILILEGLFSSPDVFGRNPLVESSGELRAGLRDGGLVWLVEHRPFAVQRRKRAFSEKECKRFGVPPGSKPPQGWREQVLNLGDKMGKKEAEDFAIEKSLEIGELPRGLTRGEQGAWAEGSFLARARPREVS